MSEQMTVEWGLLERLCGDQPEFMSHLIALYIEDTRRDLRELERAHASGELDEAQRIAHRMRGAARTIGAPRVAASCQSFEAVLESRDPARGAPELMEIALQLETVFALLRTRLTAVDAQRTAVDQDR